MRSHFKVTRRVFERIREDLLRPHPFALERVGFVACRFARYSGKGELLILANSYHPVDDNAYIDDSRFGALIGSEAIRMAFQLAYSLNVGVFHVHLHSHYGVPSPSSIDLRETAKFIPDFFNVRPLLPHGALILSLDSISGRFWQARNAAPQQIGRFTVVGSHLWSPE